MIVCISVPFDVHCWAIARVNTSIDVVIDLIESVRAPRVVPVISTVCERCMRSVSPMWGRIWSRTGWLSTVLAKKTKDQRG